jgi:hypothetical protein
MIYLWKADMKESCRTSRFLNSLPCYTTQPILLYLTILPVAVFERLNAIMYVKTESIAFFTEATLTARNISACLKISKSRSLKQPPEFGVSKKGGCISDVLSNTFCTYAVSDLSYQDYAR